MYSPSDPRSTLKTAGATAPAQTPYAGDAQAEGFSAAEYVKFHELPPQEDVNGTRTWYSRGQNFVVAYSEAAAGAVLSRSSQVDEYVLLLPDAATTATITTPTESKQVAGYSLIIVPPGDSTIAVSGGVIVRVFTARSQDLTALCSNAPAYAHQHSYVPPFQAWPDPPAGHRIRAYSLDVPPKEGRFGRIWRCSGLMINFLPHEPNPRDVTRLSPHHHDDFEQGSLALQGAFTHHIRWPWKANSNHWRNDEHEHCPAPSLAVIPPPAIHTSAATRTDGNQLVDIFSPPRMDFSNMAGWVLNAAEYPMP
ncbi:MAG: hypothetical protein ABW106_10475 [Steroidobacteraceae bacterium]